MLAFLLHLPALIAAAVLTLPAGYCCYPGAVAAGQSPAGPQRSCCDKSVPAHESPVPRCPDGACCCAKQAVSPRDLVQATDFQTAGIVAAVPTPPQPTAPQPVVLSAVVLPTGPPLHVLHCVWLI